MYLVVGIFQLCPRRNKKYGHQYDRNSYIYWSHSDRPGLEPLLYKVRVCKCIVQIKKDTQTKKWTESANLPVYLKFSLTYCGSLEQESAAARFMGYGITGPDKKTELYPEEILAARKIIGSSRSTKSIKYEHMGHFISTESVWEQRMLFAL